MSTVKILVGDVRHTLAKLPDASVHCCVTSPPYWGLRDYGNDAQIGLEQTPEEYVAQMVAVFREVRRVLRDDGTLWLNLGDSYAGPKGNNRSGFANPKDDCGMAIMLDREPWGQPKQLVGIPWRVAFALQADGWWLRQDIIWHKPNPMPESVTDRCTKAHEYVFLLTKRERYFYDAEAIKEAAEYGHRGSRFDIGKTAVHGIGRSQQGEREDSGTRNRRSVWTITTKPCKEAHFAVMPPDLAEPCILAGCPVDGTVLDPFGGAGTTGLVAQLHERNAILCELNPKYAKIAKRRIQGANPMFTTVEVVQ